MKIVFVGDEKNIHMVYPEETLAALVAEGADLHVYTKEELLGAGASPAEYLFTTWGMPQFTCEEIRACLPRLRAVFYAAGSVQGFAKEFLECGVKVFSAWGANAVPVAEYTVAQIVLANKGFFAVTNITSPATRAEAMARFGEYPGNYGCDIGIIGAGMIGKLVIKMLSAYHFRIKVFDPFLSAETAKELGVTLTTLEDIFKTCTVVSNHLANNAQTQGILNYDHFRLLRKNATFINTGRGAQVVEEDLVRALREEPSRVALLDVTWPEPPVEGHLFYTMPNVILTPHIAGSAGGEVQRMSAFMLEEYRRLVSGASVQYEVTSDMLATMA